MILNGCTVSGNQNMLHEIIDSSLCNTDCSFVSNLIPNVLTELYNPIISKNITIEIIRDAFRKSQVQGKQWLLNTILTYTKKDNKILVIGGWLGFISYALFNLGYTHITEVDIDGTIADFSKNLNRFNPDFKHISADINEIDLSYYDTIINTSCEHILNNVWYDRISHNTNLFLQSTNLVVPDHVNLVQSIDEMKTKYPCNVIYSGELKFSSWTRFFIYGKKI